ncbi:hypothetical protein ABEF95_007713 [Exophiala dermatitidis]
MGRRPDALIAQYFARGAKIGDASNRYEYTCSRCGAHFPKGRRETLNAHLTKKCPSVSEAERIEIGWRLLDLPAPNEDSTSTGQKGATVNSGSGTSAMVASSSSTATTAQDGQRQQQQNFNGLNVLAEASRQVGGNNSSGYTPANQAQNVIAKEDADTTAAVYHSSSSPRQSQSQSHQQPEAQQHGLPLDPQLSEDAFTQQLLLHAEGMSGVARNNGFPTIATSPPPPTTTTAASTASGFPGLYSFTTLNNHDHLHAVTTQGQEFAAPSLTSTHPPPDLSSIAASANATLAGHMTDSDGNDNDIGMTDHDVSEALLEELREQTQALPQTSTSLTWAPTTLLGPHGMDVENSSSDHTNTHIQPAQTQHSPNPTSIEAQATTTTVPGTRMLLPAGPIPTNSNSNLSAAARPTPSTTTHFVAETGTLAKVQKPKVRGRFDDTRRKEVRELRKLGACLRCRMLKKTCSPGTPCQTCAAVETPRVWKHCCVRTKLVDAFPLYFNLVYGGFLHKRLGHLKQWSETLYDNNAHLVAWYIPEEKIRLRVQKRKLKKNNDNSNGNGPAGAAALQSSSLVADLESQQEDNSNSIIFHIHPEDVNVFDVEQLLRPLREHIITQEKSDVIRSTVAVAQALQTGAISINGNNNNTTTASPPSILSMEKNDNLLDRVIELWTATALLTNPEVCPNFMLEQDNTNPNPNHNNNNHNHTPAAANGAQYGDSGGGTNDGGFMVEGDAYAYSRTLMTLQLQAAVEKRADKLARVVMNHLEQRLLERNRNRNQSVEIVLVAFILLNCAERMCWLYRVWASEQDAEAKSRQQLVPMTPTSTPTSMPGAWPLYKPAGDFADKGEYFAGIIHLLLNLRQFEPSITVDPTTGFLAPKDPNDTALAAWLNNSCITRDWVFQATKQGRAVADSENCTSLDGTLCARLLQG